MIIKLINMIIGGKEMIYDNCIKYIYDEMDEISKKKI